MDELPDAAAVEGIMLDDKGKNGRKSVVLQYTDHAGQWHQLRMPVGSAMYLMAMLQVLKQDQRLPLPDDPRQILAAGPPPRE